MTAPRDTERQPWIVIGDVEHERLSRLAAAAIDRTPEVASRLMSELERAEVVSIERLPKNVVTIGSTVTFMDRGGGPRKVTLVYPGEADIAEGRISVLTPVGAALIGLSTGQSITWLGLDGQERWLTVLSVKAPVPAEEVTA
jgi:regulator of nucleoside diphosphate kinase